MPSDVPSIVGRWQKISDGPTLHVVPNEPKFLERLVWPLRHAKSGYVLGNFLGTIALCGIVAEMLAILLYDIAPASLGGTQLSEAQEEDLFGRKFEKLGQEQRTKVLRVLNIIDDEVKALFDIVRTTRRKYLHLYDTSHENLPEDAAQVFHSTVKLIEKGLGFGFRDTSFTIRPAFLQYMEAHGIVFKK